MVLPAKMRWVPLFLMALGLGLALGLPAADVFDAVYDESEALPYEAAFGFSVFLPQNPASIDSSKSSPGPALGADSATKCYKVRPGSHEGKRCVLKSLVILNHFLRC